MKILVTGANGMLGQDLTSLLQNLGHEVTPCDINECDITNEAQVKNFIQSKMPEIIIHCAAYTNVDKAENDIENARKINSLGTQNVAKIARDINALMVYISTDYVFDGEKNTPYLPLDNVNPQSVYGLTKYEGECAVRKFCPKHYITRTSWLYGHKGKNFVETMISLANKQELKVVDDQKGCPTWTMELCHGILKLIDINKPYGTYHICGSGETTWYGFAKEVFSLMNLNVNLKPCATDEFPRDAKRPKYSVMDNQNICPHWKISLKNYIELREK